MNVSEYNRHWGQDSRHTFEPRLSHEIVELPLFSFNSCSCNTNDWVGELAARYQHSNLVSRESDHQWSCRDSSVFWVKLMFANLKKYVDEFNRNIKLDSLWINLSEPEFHHVPCQERYCQTTMTYESSHTYFEGHLSTASKALLIRGRENEMKAFIVPSRVLLGISFDRFDETDFPPVATFKAITGDGCDLYIGEVNKDEALHVETASIPLMARLLFSYLIDSTSPPLS